MQLQSETPRSVQERAEDTLLFRGTRALQSVFGQAGGPVDKRVVTGDCAVNNQNVGLARIALHSSSTVKPGGKAPVADASKTHERSGKLVHKDSLWKGASLLKAALGNSAAAKASRDVAVKGSPPGAGTKAGSLFTDKTAPRPNEKMVWRSADPRCLGSAKTCMKKLSKRELAVKRLELRPLLNALRFVESSNRVNVPDGDDGTSIGPLQISLDYHHDVWEKRHPWERVRQIDHAEETVIQYWSIYCPKALETQDYETLAKVHNGGPRGPAAAKTVYYWSKVLRHLKEQQEIKIPLGAQHLPPQRGHGAKTKWKDAPKKADRPSARKPPLPPVALPAEPKTPAKAHRHAHHAKLVHIRKHQVPRHRAMQPVGGSKREAREPPARQASPPSKRISHSRRSSISSTASCGHFSQASSSAAPHDGGFSFTPPETPRRKLQVPTHLVIPQVSPETPKDDLTVQPGDSISQQISPAHSEASPGSNTPGGDSHPFRLRRMRTHFRDDLAGLTEQEASKAEAILTEMAQQVDRKRGALKLGFRVSPRARLSPPKRKKHPSRTSMESVRGRTPQGDEGGGAEEQQCLEQQVAAAGAFFNASQKQGPQSSDLDFDSGLSDHDVASPISSTGSLSPEKAFSMAFLQTAIRLSQKKVAAVIIQRAYRKHCPRRDFLKLRATAFRLQELVRAWQLGKPQRLAFLALIQATLNLQTLRRANLERQSTMLQSVRERIRFLSMRKAAVEIQRVWRGHLVRRGSLGGWDGKATRDSDAKAVGAQVGEKVGSSSRAELLVEEEQLDDALLSREESTVGELLLGSYDKRGLECGEDTCSCSGASEVGSVDAGFLLQNEAELGAAASATMPSNDAVAGPAVRAGNDVVFETSPLHQQSEGCAVNVLGAFVHVESDPSLRSAGSTPPLSPAREEELYRLLAELQFNYGVQSVTESDGPLSDPVSDVPKEARNERLDGFIAAAENGAIRSCMGEAASIACTFPEAETFTFQPGCREEEFTVLETVWEEVGSDEGNKEAAQLVSPPLTPWREEALFVQLAELLPSFEGLAFGGSASGVGESDPSTSPSGPRRCLFPTGEAPPVEETKVELDWGDDGGQPVERRDWLVDESWEEAGVRSAVCSPLAESEGRLTPRRETELLLQLAELIAQHAPAVVERTPPASGSCVQQANSGSVGVIGEKNGEDNCQGAISRHDSTVGREVERGGKGRTDMGALLNMHEAALRVLKEEKVASWNDRKPLDMVSPGLPAVTRCLWDEAVDDLLGSGVIGADCNEERGESQSGAVRSLFEEAQEASDDAVLSMGDEARGPSGEVDCDDAPSVSEPVTGGSDRCAGSERSATANPLDQEEVETGARMEGVDGQVSFERRASVGDEETRVFSNQVLGTGEELDVQVSFEGREFPSSGDCTPEHYPPTESDASVFALHRSDFLRTPITSPAMLRAETALLDSASKVASWNDAAANLPLSEENLRASVAAPGDTNWGLAQYEFNRASPDWNDTGSGFPEDSWTNSPSHRSFREGTDRDSCNLKNGVSDCQSPDMSLGLVRMEVEKLNSLQKGQVTPGRGVGVNAEKLALGNTEWAHARLGLGVLKQWVADHQSPEGNLTLATPQKTLTPKEAHVCFPHDGGKTFAELRRALTPRGTSPLSKSRSEPLLSGLIELPGVKSVVHGESVSPKPAQEPISCTPAKLFSTPLLIPGLETCPNPQPNQIVGFASKVPITSGKPSPKSPITMEFTLNPVPCDSSKPRPATPKSPPRGATFDSFAAPPLEKAHSAPERLIIAHSSHRKSGRDCLVCRLWGEGSSTGQKDCRRGKLPLLCTRSVNLSRSNQEPPPVSRSPSAPSLSVFASAATISSPEACTSPSIAPSSPASLPARLGSFSGYLARAQSLNSSLSRSFSPSSSSPDTLGTSRGSLGLSGQFRSSGTLDSVLSPQKASPWLAKPYPKPSVRYAVDSDLSHSESLDSQLLKRVPKPANQRSPSPKPPRPASVSPAHRHVSADVTPKKSPEKPVAKPLFGFWRKTPSPKQPLPPLGLPAVRNEPLFEPHKQRKARLEPAPSAGAARLQGEPDSKTNADGTAGQAVYHRESQDARVPGVNQCAMQGGQGEGYENPSGYENGLKPEGTERIFGGDNLSRSQPPETCASLEPSSDVSESSSLFTPPRVRAPSGRHVGNSHSDVSDSFDEVTTSREGFSPDRVTPSSADRHREFGFTGRVEVRSPKPDFDAVTPPSSGSRWRRLVSSPGSAKKSPKASATVMPALAKLYQLWEKRHVDLRIRAQKFWAIQQELTSLGDEVRMLYYASPVQGPPRVMRELEEAQNLEQGPREAEAAAQLVLKQRDSIHAGLSYQLTQTERLQLYAAWGVRRWSTGRLRRIVYRLVWVDPERSDQSAGLVMQFL